MKIFFAPNGVGLGHIRRTEAIAMTLRGHEGLHLFSTYLEGFDYAREKGLKAIPTIPLSYRTRPNGAVDYKATVAFSGLSLGVHRFLEQLLKEIQYIKRFSPDLIFSDSRASPLIAGKMLGVPSILLLNQYKVEIIKRPKTLKTTIWDNLFFAAANVFWLFMRTILTWIWGLSQIILIPDYNNPLTISLANMAIPRHYLKKVKYIGPILERRPEDLPSKNVLSRKYGLNNCKPIIYAAVSGPKMERRVLAEKLEQLFSSWRGEYLFILTRGEHGVREIKRDGDLLSFSWVDEETQYELLKACEIVVSRAGHGIITKAMAYGKPQVLIPIPDHTEQLSNAQQASKIGVAHVLDQKALTVHNFREAIKDLSRPEVKCRLEQSRKEASRLCALKYAKEAIVKVSQHLFS